MFYSSYTQRSPLSGFIHFHNGSPLSICSISTFLSNVVAGALTGGHIPFGWGFFLCNHCCHS